jgi:hypothetical protein
MLTGRAPFRDRDPEDVLIKAQRGEFPAPREVNPGVDRGLEAICLKAMSRQPEGRYPSCEALRDELELWLGDLPVSAYPEPPHLRLKRWLRKRKQLVGAAAVLVLLSVIGLAIHDAQVGNEQKNTAKALVQVGEQQTRTREALEQVGQEQMRTKQALDQAKDQLGKTKITLLGLLGGAGERLAGVPNSEETREELAKLVLDNYRDLNVKFPNDPGVLFDTAQVHRVIAGIERIMGQFGRSRVSFDEAIRLLSTLRHDHPDELEYFRCLLETHIDRAELLRMHGKTAESERDLLFAIGLSREVQFDDLPNAIRRARGSALINLSEIRFLKNQVPESIDASNEAIRVLEPLAAPDNKSHNKWYHLWLLSLALSNRALAHSDTADDRGPSADLDRAERLCAQSLAKKPDNNEARFQLACIESTRAELCSTKPAKLSDSETYYDRAVAQLDRLVSDHKLIAVYREQLAKTLAGRANVRLTSGLQRLSEAEQDSERSRRLLEQLLEDGKKSDVPDNPLHLSLLGQALEVTGRIHLARGNKAQGLARLAEANDKLKRALDKDPARVRDKSTLEKIKSRLDAPTN